MAELTMCPQCGTNLPTNAPAGICPQCLLGAGIGVDTSEPTGHNLQATLVFSSATGVEAGASLPTLHAAGPAAGKSSVKVRFFGEYELLNEVARGGMGVVYRARHVRLNRIVALKMILAGQFASTDDVQRFYTEAEAAAQLDHPGIVPIHEVGEHEGHHFFTMGFVDGGSLAARLANGPIPPVEAANLVRQIAEAMQYAHERGVIHRDLKPANVLLDRNEHPRITDFGLAKNVKRDSGLTASGQVLGTPAYMPPEQALGQGSQVKEPADIYATGAVLYALLTGRPPFQSDNPLDTLRQVLQNEPIAPRLLNPNVPRDLETVCLKCLNKEPQRRYLSAQELADDLQRFLNDEPILARPIGNLDRGWRWCRRNPVIASLTAGVAVTLLMGALISTFFAVLASSRLVVAEREEKRANREAKAAIAAKEREVAEKQRAISAEARAESAKHEAEIKRNAAQRKLYIANMRMVQQAMREGELTTVADLLNSQLPGKDEPDLRGWEWHYWQAASRREVLWSHQSPGRAVVAWHPQLDQLAVASVDGTVGLWTVAGELLRTFKHDAPVMSVAFSPHGKLLATGCSDGFITLWNAESGAAEFRIRSHPRPVSSLAFHPGGLRFAAASTGEVAIWELGTSTDAPGILKPPRLLPLAGEISSLAISPDGKWLAAGTMQYQLRIWNLENLEEAFFLEGHVEPIYSVSWNSTGTTLASMGWDGYRKWNIATRAEIDKVPGKGTPGRAVAWGSENQLAIGNDDRSIQVLDLNQPQAIKSLRVHAGFVLSVAWNSQGTLLASSDSDGAIRVCRVAASGLARSLDQHDQTVWSVAFSPNGKLLAAVGEDKTCRITEVETGRTVTNIEGYAYLLRSAQWSPDGTRLALASYDAKVKIHDPVTGAVLQEMQGIAGWATTAVWNEEGTQLASAAWDGTVKVHDAATGRLLLNIAAHTGRVEAVAWDPTGRVLASGGYDSLVRLWDAASGKELATLRGHSGGVGTVVWSPDGSRLASGGGDGRIVVWDVAQGQEIASLRGHVAAVLQLQWHRGGRRLASASADQSWKIWDWEAGQEVLSIRDELGQVCTLAWSQDGQRLAAAGSKGLVKLWDATDGYAQFASADTPSAPDPEKSAELLVRTLFNRLHLQQRVLEALREDARLDDSVRAAALRLAESRQDTPASIQSLQRECWGLAGAQRRTTDQYRQALAMAEFLAKLEESPFNLNVVGLARYRAGKPAEAVQALERARQLYLAEGQPDHPACLAFLALAQQELSQADVARETLAALRRAMQRAPWASSAELRDFHREADWKLTQWQPLEPREFTSQGGATLRQLDDHSLLAVGSNPPHDTYRVTFQSPGQRITALRLEVLQHDSLPARGPGRQPENGTFELRRVEAALNREGASKPVVLRHAVSDFSQRLKSPLYLLDSRPNQGWAIWREDYQVAAKNLKIMEQAVVFELAEPCDLGEGDELVLTISHGPATSLGRFPQANLGRFRWSVTAAERPPAPPPEADLRPELARWQLPPRSQSPRLQTCSVCVVASALELALARKTGHGQRLSVEYLNWSANAVLGPQVDRGQYFRDLLSGVNAHGICAEERMAYQPRFDPTASPSTAARHDAQRQLANQFTAHWIREWRNPPELLPDDLAIARQVLAAGWPVCAGGEHSLLLVGYRNDPQQPGGGVFIASDSARGDYSEVNYQTALQRFYDLVWVHCGPVSTALSRQLVPEQP